MLYQGKAKLFLAFFIGLVLLPFSVSAIVFNPDADMNINLEDGSTLNFDSFSIQEGVSINYFAPENSLVNIVSEGDIDIAGTINILNKSSLSLTSKQGSINLSGSIIGVGSTLYLKGHEGNVNYGDVSLFSNAGLVTSGGGLFTLIEPIGMLVEYYPQPSYYMGSVSSTQVLSLALVPLPAPIWLFGSSLFLLIGCKKKGGKGCAVVM